MTRVTRTLPKLNNGVAFRSISSSATASRPSNLLNSSNESAYLPRKLSELKQECQRRQLKSSGSKAELVNRLNAFDITRSHSTINVSTALHRPSANAATQPIFRPLMQTFQTSATKQASRDSSTIDFFFLPQMPMEESSSHFNIRVPILPDTEIPHHTARTPEILDSAIASPEIMVVAHHPEVVIAAAMTEVVGNAGVEEDIEVLSRAAEFKQAWRDSSSSLKESSSTLKQLWNGVIDDVFGPKRGAPVIA